MEQSKFIKKLAIWVAIVGAVIALVIGLCFGKQIETTLFGEISKWIVMSAAVAVNNIQVVSALPASPDANTLYLIPE